jgi:hypothetical protein
MRTRYRSINLKRIDLLEDLGVDGRITLEGGRILTGFTWFMMLDSGMFFGKR